MTETKTVKGEINFEFTPQQEDLLDSFGIDKKFIEDINEFMYDNIHHKPNTFFTDVTVELYEKFGVKSLFVLSSIFMSREAIKETLRVKDKGGEKNGN